MKSNVEIGKRIRERREELGMTQEELGKSLWLNKSTIQRYESGKIERIKLPVIHAIAKQLRIDPDWLILDTDEKGEFQEKHSKFSLNNDIQSLPNAPPTQEDPAPNISEIYTDSIYQIPVFENVSAGFGAYADSRVIDYTPVYIKNPADARNTIAIKVEGDSMYPKIEDGDIIVVRKQDSVDSGAIAVVLIDGDEGFVKKVVYGEDWLDLISINPEYKTRHYEGADAARIRVVGQVVQIIKTL